MDGNGAASGGFPGDFAGAPDANTASMSSGSNVNSSSVVSVGSEASTAPALSAADAGDATGAEPAAKRIKVEPFLDQPGGSSAVANMAAIATNRAAGVPSGVGSGMSTEQFLQSLPREYSTKPPAYMVMLQQQQQLQQQQAQQQLLQQHIQQMQRQQQHHLLQQRQQQQLQQHIQLQTQLQLQRQQQMQAGGMPFAVVQQQQFASQAQALQTQAQQIMMAAMMQNTMTQIQPQQQIKTEPKAVGPAQGPLLVGQSGKKPQPYSSPSCLVCCQKDDDLLTCSYGCGLSAHPHCIGQSMILSPIVGGKICASCSLTQLDRNSKENIHKGGSVYIAVRRAILCVNTETTAATNFEKFGHLASLRLHEIAQIAGYPIAPFASKYIEPHLQRWMSEKLVHIASWPMNVRDVFTMMIGLYSLDRAGISHGWRGKAIELVQSKNYSPTDFLGWHPAIEGPSIRCSSLCAVCCVRSPPEMAHCTRCRRPLVFPTIFTKFVSALLASHYAEHVGISFGASFLDVFSHTFSVRSHYKGLKPIDPNGYDWDMFADQMRMIFGLLDIVSDFGVLELDANLFDAEANLIFNQNYLNQAMILMEFETVGKFLQCMKLFGNQRADQYRAAIENCERYLIGRQQPNGSWCKSGATVIDQFKATVVCAKALVNPVIRGRGPVNGDLQRLLVKWAKKTPGNLHAKRAEQLGQGKLLAAGVAVAGRTIPNLKKLEVFYRRQIVPTSGLNSLETLASARLKAIWSLQKPDLQDGEIKDETGSGITDSEDADNLSVKNEKSEDGGADEDDSLIKLSLSGDLSLFDGLKFEDGDVIDISGNGDAGGTEKREKLKADDDEGEADDQADNSPPDDQEVAEDAGNDVYDDDDDADAEGDADVNTGGATQLPDPDDTTNNADGGQELDINDVDITALDGDLQLDDSYSQSMDLALDM